MDNIPVMLKLKEVPGRFPGVTEYFVRQLVVTGKLPAVIVGQRKYLIAESVLAEFLLKGNNQIEQPQGKIRRLS